jgi:hypothetical protein
MNTEMVNTINYGSEKLSDTVNRLKIFLATAPADWSPSYKIKRFVFPNGQKIACVLWDSLFHITGTDIVKIITFRFASIGRQITNVRKFEEGIFSDLRNLKAGTDATLEPAKSDFLAFLFRNRSIRTQKKQKIFYWFSVNHDKLFMDALERDLKREFPLYPDIGEDRNIAQVIQLAKSQCNGLNLMGNVIDSQVPKLQITPTMQTSTMITPTKPTPGGLLEQALKAFESDPLGLSPNGLYFSSNPNSSFQPLQGTQAEYNAGWINSTTNAPQVPQIDWDEFSKNELSSNESFYEDDANQRVFTCSEPDCGASFKRKQHLIRHQQGHNGGRQFKCLFEGCNKSFTRVDNLSAHERRCHPNYKRSEKPTEVNPINIKSENNDLFMNQKTNPYFFETDAYMQSFDKSYNRIDESFYSL